MQTSKSARIAVVGGGQAAAQTVFSLRQWGFDGSITLVSEEPFPPYQRPPLSKAYLKGDFAEERLFFKQAPWYEDNGIDLVLATRATAVDRAARRIDIEHGGHIDYDTLVVATGSRARRLPLVGANQNGVFELRTLSDVERIRPKMIAGKRLVIAGAGYIGLEVAATARQLGLDVTVLEYAPRVLARVTSPVMSAFYRAEHAAQGIDIRTDARLDQIIGEGDQVTGVRLADGTALPADLVLVAVGIVPNEELASDAGVECDDGIVVDRDARTSDPTIYAVGDCTRRPLVHFGRSARLESVHNAIEQGRLAAAAIVGQPRPAEDCPWFWSDQYDLKLQIAGLSHGHDDLVVRGEPAARKFAVFYFKQRQLIATDAVNSPPEFMLSKKLITAGAKIDRQTLADTSVSMKDIVATAKC